MGKIGREYLLTVKGCLPADDADDPKYAEFGRELIRSGKGVFTEHGLLFVDEDTPFVKDYDGQNFPAYEKLQSIGIMQPPKQIPLTDNEDEDIGVKLFSDNDFGNHLLLTLSEDNSLADANLLTYILPL